MTISDFPTDQTFHQFHDLYTELYLHRIMSGFHGAFATGVASQQGTLTLPDTWFRPPFWDLLMLQLLRPNSSNLPCLYSTFHLEYPLVLSRFCFSRSGVKGQGHMLHINGNFVNTIQTELFKLGPSNLVKHTTYDKRTTPIDFQGQGSMVKVMLDIVVKSCKHDTDWTIYARTVKLDTHTTYDKRMKPIDFQGRGSKVKVTRYTVFLNLVKMIQTELFQLGPSNLIHILLMTRGRHLLISKVRGQRLRSHAIQCC